MKEGKRTSNDAQALGPATSRWKELTLLVAGGVLLAIGCVATFVASQDLATVSLILGGAAIVVFWAFGDRIILVKYRDYEIHLARELLETAEAAEREGADELANRLREEVLSALERVQVGPEQRRRQNMRLIFEGHRFEQEVLAAVNEAVRDTSLEIRTEDARHRLDVFACKGNDCVGIEIKARLPVGAHSAIAGRLLLGLHGTPGLRGAVVILNAHRQSTEVLRLQAALEYELNRAMKVRVAGWQPGDPVDVIRDAVLETFEGLMEPGQE